MKQADQAAAMSDYARRGYNVVIGAGGEFTASAARVAKQFPDAIVVVLNGAPTESVATINYYNQEFGYILGFIGGKMSKSGKAGLVGGQEIKAFVDIGEGFKAGWAKAGASGEVMVAVTDDWDDVAKAKEVTLNLINQGADVVLPYLDNGIVGVVQAAEEKGVWVTGVITDLGKSSKANLASTVLDFAGATALSIKMARTANSSARTIVSPLDPKQDTWGRSTRQCLQKVRAEVEAIIASMKDGSFKM